MRHLDTMRQPGGRRRRLGVFRRARQFWHDSVDRWMKVLITVAGAGVAMYTMSSWIDHSLGWYLQRSALAVAFAGEFKAQEQKIQDVDRKVQGLKEQVDRSSRLSLQKQEIDLSKEITFYERSERAGRLSPGEASYLNILRQQRDEVRRELRRIGRSP